MGNPGDQGDTSLGSETRSPFIWSVSYWALTGMCVAFTLAFCLHRLQRKGKQAWNKGGVSTTDQVSLEDGLLISLFNIEHASFSPTQTLQLPYPFPCGPGSTVVTNFSPPTVHF